MSPPAGVLQGFTRAYKNPRVPHYGSAAKTLEFCRGSERHGQGAFNALQGCLGDAFVVVSHMAPAVLPYALLLVSLQSCLSNVLNYGSDLRLRIWLDTSTTLASADDPRMTQDIPKIDTSR